MIGKEKIKFVRSLHQKKFRQKYNKFIAEGPKIVGECILHAPEIIETIYALPSFIQTLDNQSNSLKKKLIEINSAELKKISALEAPNQVIVILNLVGKQKQKVEGDALYLDGVQIPNNVGAILRIADWFGINNIFFSSSTADVYSPKVIQASMGSFLRLRFEKLDGKALSTRFPGYQIVVADGGGASLETTKFGSPSILILGSEGGGPSQEVIDQSDSIIAIPRSNGQDLPESLNVSVAAGIICNYWKG